MDLKTKPYDDLSRFRKSLDKTQYAFMIKAVKTIGLEGTNLNTIKAICGKLTVNIILNREKLEVISLKSGSRQDPPLYLLLLFNIILEALVGEMRMRREKKIEGIQTGKEEIKPFLFIDDTIFYI